MQCSIESSVRVAARVLAVVAVGVVAVCLTACNTVKGAGRDIQEAGEAGERAIDGD